MDPSRWLSKSSSSFISSLPSPSYSILRLSGLKRDLKFHQVNLFKLFWFLLIIEYHRVWSKEDYLQNYSHCFAPAPGIVSSWLWSNLGPDWSNNNHMPQLHLPSHLLPPVVQESRRQQWVEGEASANLDDGVQLAHGDHWHCRRNSFFCKCCPEYQGCSEWGRELLDNNVLIVKCTNQWC